MDPSARSRSIILLLAFACFMGGTFAQHGLLRKAERKFEEQAYAQASYLYERAFYHGVEDTDGIRHLAMCYEYLRDPENAELWYERLVRKGAAMPEDLYAYAEILRMNRKYQQADIWMDRYASWCEEDPRSHLQARSIEVAQELIEDPYLQARVVPLEVNSTGDEISPAIVGERLLFASSRMDDFNFRKLHPGTGQPYLDLFIGKIREDGQVRRADKYGAKINSALHESHATITTDQQEIFFTGPHVKDRRVVWARDGANKLAIYHASKARKGWERPSALTFNDPEYSMGQASISADGSTLYFVSDMPSGHGGTDIYRCTRNADGSWSRPQDLGPKVNTPGNERSPHIRADGTLYFASNGHRGLGGLDLYMTILHEGEPTEVMNLGAPINSNMDDHDLVLTADGTHGYFVSDRPGGAGGDDLYFLEIIDRPENAEPAGTSVEALGERAGSTMTGPLGPGR